MWKEESFQKGWSKLIVQGMRAGGTEKKGRTQMQDRVLPKVESYLPTMLSPDPAMNIT